MGWFYGFKLHIVINNKGELMNFKLTKGNIFNNRVIKVLLIFYFLYCSFNFTFLNIFLFNSYLLFYDIPTIFFTIFIF